MDYNGNFQLNKYLISVDFGAFMRKLVCKGDWDYFILFTEFLQLYAWTVGSWDEMRFKNPEWTYLVIQDFSKWVCLGGSLAQAHLPTVEWDYEYA